MKTKTKIKDIKDLQYPCYFTVKPKFKEGEDPIAAVEAQNQVLVEQNPYLRAIQEHNCRFIENLMPKTDSEIADEDFFQFIKYDPVVLSSRFAQEKILKWQRNIASFEAESNLKRIGSTLALKGTHLPGTILLAAFFKDFLSEFLTKPGRDEMLQVIEDSAQVVIRDDKDIAPLYQDMETDKKNLPRLINLIVARMLKTTEAMVRKYLKQVTDIYENGQKIGYAIEVRTNGKTTNSTD